MATGGKTIFLTGASGVVGQAVLERLSDIDAICLTHREPVARSGITALPGDVTSPHLGLSSQQFEDAATRTDYIVHSAAVTDFSQSEELVFDTNVEGTKRVLEFAAKAGAPLCHVSTAFAYSDRHISGFEQNPYERSKLEAERLVRESGVPNVIVRPSIVIGDSMSGQIAHFQGFHFLMDLTVKGMLPVSGNATSLVDFVPQDLVASVIVSLAEKGDVTGEYWITAGDNAMSLEGVVDLWFEHWERITGRTVKRPRFLAPDVIERLFLPVFLPSLPPGMQTLLKRTLLLSKFTNVTHPFPSSLPQLAELLGTRLPFIPEVVLTRNVEYFVAKSSRAAQSVTTRA